LHSSTIHSIVPAAASKLQALSAPAPAPDPSCLSLPSPSADTPEFFQSTKFFACLDVEQARELSAASTLVTLQPGEVLFWR
jgi:hypothetical protein